MRNIAGIVAAIFISVVFSHSAAFAADKRATKLYELYNSTSTLENYRQTLKHSIDRKERAEQFRDRAKRAAGKRALSRPSGVRAAGVSSVPASADPGFSLGEVYCYPNPAKRTNPTFHIETGLADKVELRLYNTAGDIVHEKILAGQPQLIDDGQGPQYAYEYPWNVGNVGSGVYIFSMTARRGDKTLKKTGRCAVIK